MKKYSTREAATQLGISFTSMNRYLAENKIPAPPLTEVASIVARLWSDEDIERVRMILPKIANGRKTRHKRKRSANSSQQSVKTEAPARVPVPHKTRKPKRKNNSQPFG